MIYINCSILLPILFCWNAYNIASQVFFRIVVNLALYALSKAWLAYYEPEAPKLSAFPLSKFSFLRKIILNLSTAFNEPI